MAGLGYKNFNTGDVLTAGDVDNYLMEQTVMVFADSAARTTALASVLAEGMISYLKDTNSTEYYSGSAWAAIGGSATPTLVGCRLTKSANQSLTDSTETAITFDGESWDTNGFHDNVTNNTRITIPAGYTGKYELSGVVSIAPMVGNYYVLIKKNGSVLTYTVVQYSSNSSLDTGFTFSQLLSLTAADYVELFLYQASGSAKNCQTGTSFAINYLGA